MAVCLSALLHAHLMCCRIRLVVLGSQEGRQAEISMPLRRDIMHQLPDLPGCGVVRAGKAFQSARR